MNTILCPTLLCATLLTGTAMCSAQGTQADYDRAGGLAATTRNKVFKAKVDARWLPGNDRFWYRNNLAGGTHEYVLVDADKGTRGPAFDQARLATALSKASGQTVAADRLLVDRLEYDGDALLFTSNGKWWRCDLKTYEVKPEPRAPAAGDSLPFSLTPHPSLRTGAETSVTFVNRTDGNVELFWINPDGDRQRYATIHAGDQYEAHTYAGHVWLATDPAGKTLAVFEATEAGGTAVIDGKTPPETRPGRRGPRERGEGGNRSPDGKWAAFIRDFNVFVRDTNTGHETALSTDGKAGDAYDGQFRWSPDAKHVVAVRTLAGDDRKVYLIESSPRDQLQPKLQSYDYLKPGDRIPLSKPHLFDIEKMQQVPVADTLFPNPWSITELRWTPDSSRFTFLYNQRGHQVLRIITVDAATGAARPIVDEVSKTFLDYAGKQFSEYLDGTHEIIWMSERDGWNHLYLYDAATGTVKNQITKGQWAVRGVDQVDAAHRQVWFRAGGIEAGQDPYYIHYCRINFDGSGLLDLTPGDGTHSISFSPDRRFLVDTYSRVDLPPATELRRSDDGKLVCPLEHADWSALLRTGWRVPERFVAKGRDGATDIYGVIFRPTNLDPARKYPVIENIYAGPQDSFVPKAFSPLHGSQELAELGFIVVQIDGMGTSNRSKAFHDVCWRNLGDAGFPDRIPWIKAAAAKYPYMDTSRVGIYGTSAGGQSALRALLAYGDFYKVAVADSGCHDNRMDKIWWNELWMGWPVGPWYDEQSNVTQAYRLQGKLLLMEGELDKNVDPASTMQVVNALIKANKDFDLLIVPGAGHGVSGSPYGKRRRNDFLVRHLLGVEPRH